MERARDGFRMGPLIRRRAGRPGMRIEYQGGPRGVTPSFAADTEPAHSGGNAARLIRYRPRHIPAAPRMPFDRDRGGKRGVDLNEFLNHEVYPRLFDRLDAAFPEFAWARRGKAWVATAEAASRRLPEAPRPDRVYCYENRPWGMLIHGGGFVRWLEYLKHGHNLSGPAFIEAVGELASLAGARLPAREYTSEEMDLLRARAARHSILETSIEVLHLSLLSDVGDDARAYLKSRGLHEDAIAELRIGFYSSRPELANALEKAGLDPVAVQQSGILWDQLEGYVLFPWMDAHGHPQSLYGRWPSDLVPAGHRKYLALPGEGTKASPLYLDRARRAGCRDLVLVEGLLDAAVAQVTGDPRVIACMAARPSQLQVETLRRHKMAAVTLCLDPDDAGDDGTLATIDTFARAGLTTYVAPRLPDGLDPDAFILKGGLDAWRNHIAAADHAFRFRAKVLVASFIGPAGERDWTDKNLVDCLDAALEVDAGVTDPQQVAALESFFWPEIFHQTGFSEETVRAQRTALRDRLRTEQVRRDSAALIRQVQETIEQGHVEAALSELGDGLRRIGTIRGGTAPAVYTLDAFLREIREIRPACRPDGTISTR